MKSAICLPLVLTGALASPLGTDISKRATDTATVDLSVQRGAPEHLASGWIYGIPDTENQIPDHFYTDVGFRYTRAGGAQLEAPSRGWIWGLAEYKGRLESTLSNYRTARKYGASFIILPHDVWGTDHSNASTVWPGDNGNWADYDKFLDQLLSDLKANNAVDGLVWDTWNEPDLTIFWNRSQQQWVDLYVRTHKRIRQDSALAGVQISGPSLAGSPTTSNAWWSNWLSSVAGNDTIPDQYSWHLEGGPSDPNEDLQTNNDVFPSMLSAHGLPERQININEYATFSEQVASGAAWWISRLERYNALGLRGNWLSSFALHDLFGSLLSKPNAGTSSYDYYNTDYFPNGEYQVYKYYNLNMTGTRVQTTGTGDRLYDVYATVGSDKVRLLTGARVTTGNWYITVNRLSSVGLPTSGTLNIQTWGFVDNGHYGEVDAPSNRGIVAHTYSGDSVTFPIYQTDSTTAWAFEFSI